MAGQQAGTDGHSLHKTMCVVLWNSGDFKQGCFPLVSKYLSNAKTCICICILFLSFHSVLASLCCGLSSFPLYALFWWCQVTARYLVEERIFSAVLDLLFLQDPRGRGGVAPPLTSVYDWSDHSHVAMLCSTALPCYGTLSTLCGMTFDVPFH